MAAAAPNLEEEGREREKKEQNHSPNKSRAEREREREREMEMEKKETEYNMDSTGCSRNKKKQWHVFGPCSLNNINIVKNYREQIQGHPVVYYAPCFTKL